MTTLSKKLKQTTSFLFTFCLSLVFVFAQAPNLLNYQMVVRNTAGVLIPAGSSIGARVSILQGSASGTPVYVERQTVTTNANGLASFAIGSGSLISGDFTTINWAADSYFLMTEIDPTGGSAYTITGTSQLLSVPYALNAKTADVATSLAGGIPSSWSPNGNDISNSNSGNVGIGTATPVSKLAVISGASTALRLESDAGATVLSVGGSGVVSVDANGVPGGRFNIQENGYVGIGTSAASYPLDVHNTDTNYPDESMYAARSNYEGVKGISAYDDGVQGETNNASYFGVSYVGGLGGSGTKNCIERTAAGPKLMYCQESPENWFEDFGNAVISGGTARVDIKADIKEVLTVNAQNPIHPFITPNSNMGNWWVVSDDNGFTVHAPNAANGSTFDWRMVAKRQHFETRRMDLHESSFDDFYLYPEYMGAYPEDVYTRLKPNSPVSYNDYLMQQRAKFVPHNASPYNSKLPSNWQALKAEAKKYIADKAKATK